MVRRYRFIALKSDTWKRAKRICVEKEMTFDQVFNDLLPEKIDVEPRDNDKKKRKYYGW